MLQRCESASLAAYQLMTERGANDRARHKFTPLPVGKRGEFATIEFECGVREKLSRCGRCCSRRRRSLLGRLGYRRRLAPALGLRRRCRRFAD